MNTLEIKVFEWEKWGMTDSRNCKKERGPAVWLGLKTILLLCLWQCWKPDAVCYGTAQQVETGQRLQLHLPHLVSMAICLMSCVFVYFTVLIRTISLGNWGSFFFFPFGTDIWGSTTSVTFDASGHLSDQWVWPSVWSLRVASCFVLGTLRPPYEYSFALRYKKLFKSLSNYFSVIRGLHLHHLRSICLSIECVDLFMAFQAQWSLWHNQRLPPGPPP